MRLSAEDLVAYVRIEGTHLGRRVARCEIEYVVGGKGRLETELRDSFVKVRGEQDTQRAQSARTVFRVGTVRKEIIVSFWSNGVEVGALFAGNEAGG